MIQRILPHDPKPQEIKILDSAVYSNKGQIKAEFLFLCKEYGIKQEDLIPKQLSDFNSKNVPKSVQILRFNNYESKRRCKVAYFYDEIAIIEYLKAIARTRGILDEDNNNFKNPFYYPDQNGLFQNKRKKSIEDIDPATEKRGSKLSQDNHTSIDQSSSKGDQFKFDLRYSQKNTPRNTYQEKFEDDNSNPPSPKTIDRETITINKMRESFQRKMKFKMLERERLSSAPLLTLTKEDEFRESARYQYQIKQDNYKKNLEKLNKTHRKKIAIQHESHDKKIEKMIESKRTQNQERKTKIEKINRKLISAEQRKNEMMQTRQKKFIDLNNSEIEKSQTYLQRRDDLLNSSHISLDSIESRLNRSASNKSRIRENQLSRSYKLESDYQERLQKAKNIYLRNHNELIQKIVEKTVEKSTIFDKSNEKRLAELSKSRNNSQLLHTSYDMGNKKLKEIKERQKRRNVSVDKKKTELSIYLEEKKEVNKSRLEREIEVSKKIDSARDRYKRANDLRNNQIFFLLKQ